METIRMNVHSHEYMETMARLMSEALESSEGMRALAVAIAQPIEQEIKRAVFFKGASRDCPGAPRPALNESPR